MTDNSKIKDLNGKKAAYLSSILAKGEMTLKDVNMLRNFDYHIYMTKHPRLKKFNDWLYPENKDKNNWKTRLKGMLRRTAILPVTIGYNLALSMADNHWEKKNIEYAPNNRNKKQLRRMRLAKKMAVIGITATGAMAANMTANILLEATERQNPNKPRINNDLKDRLRGVNQTETKKPIRQTSININPMYTKSKEPEL